MKRAKHSKGPWTWHPRGTIGYAIYAADALTEVAPPIALVPVNERDHNEVKANAVLFAAAAELLSSAELVLAGLNARIDAADKSAVPVFNGIAELHDAINRAKGVT